ncbi:MAG: LacI family DNA-binding transcriptional regulator [Bacteroidales bacterium]|nr:LacI family DNA-binding transcriptional regulator [Bacteroidales bacterium]
MTARRRKVTIKDIAREAGVSQALVSFVMSNKNRGEKTYRVNENTANHILEVAEKLDYQPNLSARALKRGRTGTIGVIVSDISNPFFAEVARDMEDEVYRKGYTVLFGSTDEDPAKLRRIVKVFVDKGVDGLVIVPCQHSEDIINDVCNSGIPVVLMDRRVEGLDIPSVTLNNRKASYDMTMRLIGKGYHFIEMISYDMELTNIKDREQGMVDAMIESGLDGYYKIHRVSHHEHRQVVDNIVKEAGERGGEAFVFATNTLAVRGMSSMFRGGFHIPQDFGIACFDYNSAFDIYDTELIYARQPIEMFAAKTMECVLGLVGPDYQEDIPMDTVLEAEIVE